MNAEAYNSLKSKLNIIYAVMHFKNFILCKSMQRRTIV